MVHEGYDNTAAGPSRDRDPGSDDPGAAPLRARWGDPLSVAGAYESGGYALAISWWNWAENQWPASGEFGSAPVALLPLRALPP